MSVEYNEAVSEVLQVLKRTESKLIEKIPKKLLEFWGNNASEKQNPKIETSNSLEEMNLKPKSKALIGMIYRNYWCDAEERKEYDKILKENEDRFQEEARRKYNPDDIFKPIKKEEQITSEEIQKNESNIIVYKENFIEKIIRKIKELIGR